jgi:hypothetical protein
MVYRPISSTGRLTEYVSKELKESDCAVFQSAVSSTKTKMWHILSSIYIYVSNLDLGSYFIIACNLIITSFIQFHFKLLLNLHE